MISNFRSLYFSIAVALTVCAGCTAPRETAPDTARSPTQDMPQGTVTTGDGSSVDQAETVDTENDSSVVRLRFGWRQGMVADVETVKTRINSTQDGVDTTTVTSRYKMSVASYPDGLLIQHTGFEFADIEGADEALDGLTPEMMQSFAGLMPSIVVTKEGEYVRVENTNGIQDLMGSLFSTLKVDSLQELNSFVESLRSEEIVNYYGAQDWNLLVGTWVGGEFEPDAVYGYEAEEPIPLFGGVMIPMEYEFALIDRMPCTDAPNSPECAQVAMVTKPDAEAMKIVIEDFLRRMAQDAPEQAFGSMEMTNTVVVTLEPDTMRPHRLYTERRISAEGVGEETLSTLRIEERESIYTYQE